jgi:hypothetical protein
VHIVSSEILGTAGRATSHSSALTVEEPWGLGGLTAHVDAKCRTDEDSMREPASSQRSLQGIHGGVVSQR